jgi:ribosomal protein L40E
MQKTFSLVGIIAGLIIIVIGILVLTGASGPSANNKYDTTYFKGDVYYTHIANNVVEIKNNLHSIVTACGIALIAFGLFMVCLFGYKLEDSYYTPRRKHQCEVDDKDRQESKLSKLAAEAKSDHWICDQCGANNTKSSKRCTSCGVYRFD